MTTTPMIPGRRKCPPDLAARRRGQRLTAGTAAGRLPKSRDPRFPCCSAEMRVLRTCAEDGPFPSANPTPPRMRVNLSDPESSAALAATNRLGSRTLSRKMKRWLADGKSTQRLQLLPPPLPFPALLPPEQNRRLASVQLATAATSQAAKATGSGRCFRPRCCDHRRRPRNGNRVRHLANFFHASLRQRDC